MRVYHENYTKINNIQITAEWIKIRAINPKYPNTKPNNQKKHRQMKNILLLLALLISGLLSAQNLGKAFKQLEKQNLKKAEKFFLELDAKDANNSAIKYGLSLVYGNDLHESTDLYKAFELIIQSQILFEQMPPNQEETMLAYVSKDKIIKQKEELDKKLFEAAKKTRRLKDINLFIQRCPDSKYFGEAIKKRIEIEYSNAKSENTVDAYNTFIAQYPEAEQVEEAKMLRNRLEWARVKNVYKLNEFKNFIKTYPNAKEVDEAKKIRNSLEWKKANAIKTLEAYQYFLTNYPDAEQAPKAAEFVQSLTYKTASETNTIEAYNDFIKQFPNSKLAHKAKQKRDAIAYEMIINNNNPDDYNAFLKQYKGTENYKKVFDLKSEQRGKKVSETEKYAVPVNWLRAYDLDNKRDKLQSFDINSQNEIILAGNSASSQEWYNNSWFVKLNANGNILWDKELGDVLDDEVNAVRFAMNGDIVACGHYNSKSALTGKAWIVRFSPSGKLLWKTTFDGTDALDITPLSDNCSAIAGYTCNADGQQDFWILKISPEGKIIWNETYRGKGTANTITHNQNNEIIAAGYNYIIKISEAGTKIWEQKLSEGKKIEEIITNADQTFTATGHAYNFKEKTKSNFWFAKYSQSGNIIWEKEYDRENRHDKAYSAAPTNDGNYLIVGLTSNEDDTDDDIWILTLDEKGNKQSEKLFGTEKNEKYPQIRIASDGKIYVSTSIGLEADFVVFTY